MHHQTNTLLAEIDRKNSMQKTPSVYEIFTIADTPDAATSDGATNRSSSHSPSHSFQETDSHSLSKTDDRGNRVRALGKEQTKGVTGDRGAQLSSNEWRQQHNGQNLPVAKESTSVTISIGHPRSTTINFEPTDTSRL